MSPDDSKTLRCFAVRRGQVKEKLFAYFWKPEYTRNEACIDASHHPVVNLGQLVIRNAGLKDGPGGWLINTSEYTDYGVPILRANNVTEEGNISGDFVYISEEKHQELSATEITPDDLLLTMRGSIGRSAIVPDNISRANMNAAICRIRLQDKDINKFVRDYLNCDLGRLQAKRHGHKAVQGDLNLDAIRSFRVILPPRNIRDQLVIKLELARQIYHEKIIKTDALVSDIYAFLINQLGLVIPSLKGMAFAIQVSQLQGPFNPERYRSHVLENSISGTTIGSIAKILIDKISPQNIAPNDKWDLIRIDDLANDPIDVETMRNEIGTSIKGTYYNVQENDILLARLGPTIQNRKIVLCPATKIQTIASPEFLVLRCHEGWDPLVVLWILRTSLYRDLIYSKCRGSTPSRYRVNRDDLITLPFPDIKAIQESLAGEIKKRLAEVRRLKMEAIKDWGIAKALFKSKLLGEI